MMNIGIIPASEVSKLNTWKDKLALLISAVLSPFVLAPVFLYIFCARFSTSTKDFLINMGIAVFFSTVVPFLNAYIAVKLKIITDIHVADLKQRKEPFIVGLISFILGTATFYFVKAPIEFFHLGIVMTIVGTVFFIISLYWKISMHLGIMTALIATLAILVNVNFAYSMLLLPLVIWARIHRKRHNFYQGMTGMILAFLGVFLLFRLLGYPH